ncbi:hypothetical protein RBWH47_04731 [Rhodopirellula baltica WH47]|uniref:Uncharacterized protein n=1 Tax=Rhodopirellula baltica WH47 TaxID=991778 RepID=F2AT82_RHOBT|nr:hypothetical protein RBWH47_04731 [Rhodopirellula baltica WH47]
MGNADTALKKATVSLAHSRLFLLVSESYEVLRTRVFKQLY